VKEAKVTLNVTFDASGREIARGVSTDRRTPAEFTACLRTIPTPVDVAPPGSTVAVAVPLSYP
jgi:hypothetical protein